MKTNTQKTTVIFRKWAKNDFKGDIIALFPYEIHNGYLITSYQHVGQHSAADYNHCIQSSTPASETEYKALKCELEGLGYNLEIKQKQTYSKFLKAYHTQRHNPIM